MENQKVEPEPQHIRDILPDVMQNIEGRMQRRRRSRTIQAVKDFLAGQRNPAKWHILKARTKHVRQ